MFKGVKTFLPAATGSVEPDWGILCSSLADPPIMRSCTATKAETVYRLRGFVRVLIDVEYCRLNLYRLGLVVGRDLATLGRSMPRRGWNVQSQEFCIHRRLAHERQSAHHVEATFDKLCIYPRKEVI